MKLIIDNLKDYVYIEILEYNIERLEVYEGCDGENWWGVIKNNYRLYSLYKYIIIMISFR